MVPSNSGKLICRLIGTIGIHDCQLGEESKIIITLDIIGDPRYDL